MLQYCQDFDEAFPISSTETATYVAGGKTIGWTDGIFPYVKSRQVYQCPSEKFGNNATDNPTQAGYSDYYINKNGTDGEQTLPVAYAPTLTILFGDGGALSTDTNPLGNSTARYRSNGCFGAGGTITNTPDPSDRKILFVVVLRANNLGGGGVRHLEGCNFAFFDGHVKWFRNADAQTPMKVWNGLATFDQSGNDPTFRLRLSPR